MMNFIQLEGSEEFRMIQQTEPLADIQIHVSVFGVFLPHLGRTRHLEIITLYVPQNHWFWWNWQLVHIRKTAPYSYNGRRIDTFLGRWAIHSSDRKITCFTCFGSNMYVIESSENWKTYLDAYNNALSILEKEGQQTTIRRKGIANLIELWVSASSNFLNFVENGQKESADKKYKYKVIFLDQYITDPRFYNTKCIGRPIPKTKISVKKHDTQWHVELEGASQKTATFILDENYEVLDVFGKAVEGPLIYERR